MIIIELLSLLVLVVLSVSSSIIKLDSHDTFRDLDSITRDVDINELEKVNERQFAQKEAQLMRDSDYLTSTTSTNADRLRHIRSPKSKEEDICGLRLRSDRCNDLLFSSVSSSISSSVSSAVSSSVLNNDASILTLSMSAIRDEGFRDGQSRASESAQIAIDSAKASASSVVESVFSVVRSTPSARETTPSVTGSANRASRSLAINAGQLAGIIVGVFFASSILSVLTILFFLWYRRRKAAFTHNTRHIPVEEKKKMHWPTLGKLRGNLFHSSSVASETAGRRDLPGMTTPGLKHWKPSQNQQGMAFGHRMSFASPISPSSNNDQTFPVSPLSDQPPDSDSSPSLGIGLYGNRTQTSSGSEDGDVPTIGFSHLRNPTQPKSPHGPIIRMEGQETNPRLPSNIWAAQRFPSNERSVAFADVHEKSDTRDATNRMERGMATFTPVADRRTFSPPIIPLRFSSLNARKGPPIQSSADLHDTDGTFLLSTDEESADRDPESPQIQSALRSPSPSQSSVISQDLTQFDPGGPGPQPISRFSVSSAPLSLGYSASSSSPAPQQQQQQENPEIRPLRPAPPSPSQLHSPIPRRLNAAVSLASLEPSIHQNSQEETNIRAGSEGDEGGTGGG